MQPRRFVLSMTALLSASGLVVGPAGATSCPFAIEWKDMSYEAANFHRPVAFGPSATVPTCDGGARCSGEGGERIEVFRLQGVDPQVGVGGTVPSGREAFLAPGFFVELPEHPLHEAAYGSPRRPNERAGWRCGEPIRNVVGTVTSTPGWGRVFGVRFDDELVRRDGDQTPVFVDARTTITGFEERGLSRIVEGDEVVASVRECTASGGRYMVVADGISNSTD